MRNQNIKASIVAPAYNERENIELLCDGIRNALDDKRTYEIIVVNDNSPGGAAGADRRLADGCPGIKLLERPQKSGLASAVAAGFSVAQGD